MHRALSLVSLTVILAACQPAPRQPEVGRTAPPVDRPVAPLSMVPANVCWATDRVPAETRTVFDETGPDGARTPREEILRPSEERLFAVPCPEQMSGDFIASLQRALRVRGLFTGAVTGAMNAQTEAAVRSFQAPQGLNSAILSLEGAQLLGLVPVARGTL
tara:strand:+ start:15790 stop:16272 length:483 start_codon:yes stop_codon:yes gene_type:complete